MWGDHLIRYQTLLPDKGEIRLLLGFLHRICIPALVDLSWLWGTRSCTLKDGNPSSTFVAKLLIKIDRARSTASSSQQIVPYNSASSAKSLTVELRPSRKSFTYIKNSNGPNPSPGERRMSWLQEQLMLPQLLNNKWTRLSILWRIMEIEEGVTASTDNTLRDLHNSSYDTKAEFNNCLIIHSK